MERNHGTSANKLGRKIAVAAIASTAIIGVTVGVANDNHPKERIEHIQDAFPGEQEMLHGTVTIVGNPDGTALRTSPAVIHADTASGEQGNEAVVLQAGEKVIAVNPVLVVGDNGDKFASFELPDKNNATDKQLVYADLSALEAQGLADVSGASGQEELSVNIAPDGTATAVGNNEPVAHVATASWVE